MYLRKNYNETETFNKMHFISSLIYGLIFSVLLIAFLGLVFCLLYPFMLPGLIGGHENSAISFQAYFIPIVSFFLIILIYKLPVAFEYILNRFGFFIGHIITIILSGPISLVWGAIYITLEMSIILLIFDRNYRKEYTSMESKDLLILKKNSSFHKFQYFLTDFLLSGLLIYLTIIIFI